MTATSINPVDAAKNNRQGKRGESLFVTYITMQFPYPSETFACNDVRTLTEHGVTLAVHSLRGEHPASEKLLQERSIKGVELTYNTPASTLRGLGYGLTHPFLFSSFISWIARTNWRKPEHLAKSLVLAPRALEIFSHLEEVKPDVVHIYWGHYPSLVGYLVERYLPEVRVTLSLVAYDLRMEYQGSKVVAQKADAVRTLAHVNTDKISAAFGVPEETIKIIYDGVDVERVQRKLSGVDLKQKQPKRIVSAGRLIRQKGMSEVLDVFANVLEQHPDATLVILGDGEEREALEAKCRTLNIAHAVEFKGHMNHDEVFAEMAQAELFLFLSYAERLPNVVKEAMLCECVCVVSDTIGIRELIPDDSYGYVVDSTEQASVTVLKVLSEGGKLVAPLVEKASHHIAENLSVETSASQYIDLWEGVTEKSQL